MTTQSDAIEFAQGLELRAEQARNYLAVGGIAVLGFNNEVGLSLLGGSVMAEIGRRIFRWAGSTPTA